jgi:protein O-mannosyl-transferase
MHSSVMPKRERIRQAPAVGSLTPEIAAAPSRLLPSLLLFFVAIAVYVQTINYGYVLDDAIAISKNPITQKGFGGFGELLTSDSFTGFFAGQAGQVAGGRYRPLSYLTFATEVQMFGLNPAVSHLGNVILFATTVVVLFLVIDRLFGRRKLAFAAALLFALHPIHTEAVANIKGRDEILALLLALVALLVVMNGRRPGVEASGAGVLFFLALLAKENAVAFAAVIPLALRVRTRGSRTVPLLPVMLSLGVALLAYVLLRWQVLGFGGPAAPSDLLTNPFYGATPAQRLATILHTWLLYLKLLILPWPLTSDYNPWHIQWLDWRAVTPWISLVVHTLLAVFAVLAARRREIAGYAILYYFATFALVSNLFFPVGTFMAERFVFMPSVGVCLLLSRLLENINRKAAGMMLTAIALFYGAITVTRNPAWRSDFTLALTDVHTSRASAKVTMIAGGQLWEVASAIDPEKPLPRDHRIGFYMARYRVAGSPAVVKQRMLDNAEAYLTWSIQLYDRQLWAWQLLGHVLFQQGRYDEAREAYDRALLLRPDFLHLNEAIRESVLRAADQYEAAGDIDGAIAALEESTRRDLFHPEALNNLGRLYVSRKGNLDAGIAALEQARSLEPRNVPILTNLGMAYDLGGRHNDAFAMLRAAHEIAPSAELLQMMRTSADKAASGDSPSPEVLKFLEGGGP